MNNRPLEHPDDETIFAVVHGLADQAGERLTLDHVRVCGRCSELLRTMVVTREAALCDLPPAPGGAGIAAPRASARRRAVVRAAMAAAAVLAVFIVFHLLPDEAPDGPPSYWLPTTFETVRVRSVGAGPPPALALAIAHYDKRDLDVAIRSLEALEILNGWSSLRDLYLCAALTNAGRLAEAEVVLDRLDPPTLPSDFRLAASWYRYVVLAGTGRDAAARRELAGLVEAQGPLGDLARDESRRLVTGAQGKP